jgi:S-adenosyl-L-methionine hydrolase (adenosine-forming)
MLISLLTDFGTRDEYVGVMKAVMADICPQARTVDITHGIDPQDIIHGAFILAAAYRYFPVGTVHVAVVDPGVGSARRILAVECGGYRFVAPDNGLLERVLAEQADAVAVTVENQRYFLKPVSHTFHGRDIFAAVGAHLAAGLPLSELGPALERHAMVSGVVPGCRFAAPDCLEGTVVAIDRFGNLMTSIDAAAVENLAGRTAGRQLVVELGGRPIGGIVSFYDSVDKDLPLAIIGSRGLLEISINCGNAGRTLKAGKKDGVRVYPA